MRFFISLKKFALIPIFIIFLAIITIKFLEKFVYNLFYTLALLGRVGYEVQQAKNISVYCSGNTPTKSLIFT